MRRWAILHYVIPSAIVLVLGILLLLGLDRQAHENQDRINYAALEADTQGVATLLESVLQTRLGVVDSLHAFVTVNPDMSIDEFDALAEVLISSPPSSNGLYFTGSSINGLYFADTAMRPHYSYEAIQRRTPRGERLIEGPEVEARIASAVQSGKMNVFGPVEYADGSIELFAFAPVYGDNRLLGMAVAVYDMPNLLAASLPWWMVEYQEYKYEFRLLGEGDKVLFGALNLNGRSVSREVPVGDDRWHLEMTWRKAPPATPPGTLSLIWGLGGICVLAALGWINREQLALARQSRLARENARLLAESNHLLQQTQALQAIITDVTARRTVDDVLNAVADQVAQVFGADHVGIYVIEPNGHDLERNITRKLDPAVNAAVASLYNPAAHSDLLGEGALITVENVPAAPELGTLRDLLLEHGIYALLVVPLRREGRMVGSLVLYHDKPQRFNDQECALAQTFADQAAIALENAHLLLEAHGKAALEERQRLARELHDSVSQALYGISLGARTGRTLLERDPKAAAEALEYVVSLAKAGLAEMRALIFELRPESLQNEGLVAALDKQAASMRARYNLAVQASLGQEPDVPLSAKEALYRISQEALHNVIKHAHARSVDLKLDSTPEQVTLTIRDDGKGFDVRDDFPGHLGLLSMRERVAQLGGEFEVESRPGAGTVVRARIPVVQPALEPEPERVPAQV